MKRGILILMVAITVIACHSHTDHDGIYTARIKGEYSVADDTVIVEGNFITNRTGYQKIRNCNLLQKSYKARTWPLNSEDAPSMRFSKDKVIIGQTTYNKQP